MEGSLQAVLMKLSHPAACITTITMIATMTVMTVMITIMVIATITTITMITAITIIPGRFAALKGGMGKRGAKKRPLEDDEEEGADAEESPVEHLTRAEKHQKIRDYGAEFLIWYEAAITTSTTITSNTTITTFAVITTTTLLTISITIARGRPVQELDVLADHGRPFLE
jgi:hypothetical protein